MAIDTMERDNSREVNKGWIKRADTPHDLAALINLSPEVLDATVARFNGFARDGMDADFWQTHRLARTAAQSAYYGDGIDAEFHHTPGWSAA